MLLVKLVLFCSAIFSVNTFDIEITSIDRMNPELEGILDMGTLRLVKKGRNLFKVSGTIQYFKNVGDEVIVSIDYFLNIHYYKNNFSIGKFRNNSDTQKRK